MSTHELSLNRLTLRTHGSATTWQGTFDEFLALVANDPAIARNRWQRLIDMIDCHGSYAVAAGAAAPRWRLFDDPLGGGRDAVYGLDEPLNAFVQSIRACATGCGPEWSGIPLSGPLRAEKSTIVRLLKRGLERYAQRDDGAQFTFDWEVDGELVRSDETEDPLVLVPRPDRSRLLSTVNASAHRNYRIRVEGEPSDTNRFWLATHLKRHHGDWSKAVGHVRVRRVEEFDFETAAPSESRAQQRTDGPVLGAKSNSIPSARQAQHASSGQTSGPSQVEELEAEREAKLAVPLAHAVDERVDATPPPLFRVKTTKTETQGYMHGNDLSVILLAVVAVFAIMAVVVATRPELIWWLLDRLPERN